MAFGAPGVKITKLMTMYLICAIKRCIDAAKSDFQICVFETQLAQGETIVKHTHTVKALSSRELALVQLTIGTFILDRLKGHNRKHISEIYSALGGTDIDSVAQFRKLDQLNHPSRYTKERYSLEKKVINAIAGDLGVESFRAAFREWDLTGSESALIKRAIGQGVLEKLKGEHHSVLDIYKQLGGTNRDTVAALERIDARWQRWEPNIAAEHLNKP